MKAFANLRRDFRENRTLYFLSFPVVLYFLIFCYLPMDGIVIAFQKYNIAKGIFGSRWVGFSNFTNFFESYYFGRLLSNTFFLSFLNLLFSFPVPIAFALLLNEVRNRPFKRTIQTLSYMPYFISLVVVCGLVVDFTNANGIITNFLSLFGREKTAMLGDPKNFRPIYIMTDIWRNTGYTSIVYLAALTGVDRSLYEAAEIDGAKKLRQVWHITLPGIAPTIIVMLILRVGNMFALGFEQVMLLYNPAIYESADIISTFSYRKAFEDYNYGSSTAIELFNSVINCALLLATNQISRRFSSTSLF